MGIEMESLAWVIGLLVVWIFIVVVLLTTAIVLDFLIIGRRGRLDWISNLFRKEQDEEGPKNP